jgi:hypothetical protein
MNAKRSPEGDLSPQIAMVAADRDRGVSQHSLHGRHFRSMATVQAHISLAKIRSVWAVSGCTSGCLKRAPSGRCIGVKVERPGSTTTLPRAAWRASARGSWAGTCLDRSGDRGQTTRGEDGGVRTREFLNELPERFQILTRRASQGNTIASRFAT